GADGAGALGLTDAELDLIKAGTLRIGRNDANASGTLTISNPINLTTGANTIPTLHLITGADVVQTGTGAVTATNLAVEAGTAVALDTNDSTVTNFAATSTNSAVQFLNAGGYTVNALDGVMGVRTTNNGNITLRNVAGTLTIGTATAATVVNAGGG